MTNGRAQLSLLGSSGYLPRRVALDSTSWIEHVPAWLPDHEALMAALTTLARWEQRHRWMYDKTVIEPRLTAEYPVLAEAPSARLREIGALLSDRYGVAYDNAWINLYRDHNDSTGWHGDRVSGKPRDTVIPVVSLGETRRFLVRRKAGGKSLTFTVQGGDLVVMGGRCQRDWVHCVPKERTPAGVRISINFGSSREGVESNQHDGDPGEGHR